MTFEEMHKIDSRVKPLEDVKNWCNNTTKLSNDAIKLEIEINNSEELKKALEWSIAVNEGIEKVEDKDVSYENVLETLKKIKESADIVIVSSANNDALLKEWTKNGLMTYVDEVMSQNQGSKAECIAKVKAAGYGEKNVIMIGDSPGDLNAAQKNSVYFYPILIEEEKESWLAFKDEYFKEFINENYAEIERVMIDKFYKKLEKGCE